MLKNWHDVIMTGYCWLVYYYNYKCHDTISILCIYGNAVHATQKRLQ